MHDKQPRSTPEEQLEALIDLSEKLRSHLSEKSIFDQSLDERIKGLNDRVDLFGPQSMSTAGVRNEIVILTQLGTLDGIRTFRDAVTFLALRQAGVCDVLSSAREGGAALGKTITGAAIVIGYPELKESLRPNPRHKKPYRRK